MRYSGGKKNFFHLKTWQMFVQKQRVRNNLFLASQCQSMVFTKTNLKEY